jgi:hypothetical protein
MADCTSWLPDTQKAISTVTKRNAIAVDSHHRHARYATTGKDTVQNLVNSLHSGECAPVTTERARATKPESRPTRTASLDELRTIDKWVDTRW